MGKDAMIGTCANDGKERFFLAVWHHAIILLVAGLVFFTNLGAAALFDEDEPKNAVCGREMFLRGDWIVPTFNHELRTDKPILIYWIMLCAYTVFGVNEFAARFGSSVLAVTTAVLVYHLGRKLFHPEVGLWAGVILCTCLMYSAVGRAVTPDSMLVCCVTGTFLAYVGAVSKRVGWAVPTNSRFASNEMVGTAHPTWREFTPATWWDTLPMAFAMGLGVLTKGPVAIVLPTGILGVFLLIRQQIEARSASVSRTLPRVRDTFSWRRPFLEVTQTLHPHRIWRDFSALRLPLVWTVAALVALPWYCAVGWATGGDWLAGFLGGHNVGRFLTPMESHSGPFFYYVLVILAGTFPWSVFLPVALWNACKALNSSRHTSCAVPEQCDECESRNGTRSVPATIEAPALLLLVCWAGGWMAFFSCASTKLPNYVLPSYPALALLIGWFLQRWQSTQDFETTFRNCCRLLGWTSMMLMIAAPIVLNRFLPSELWLTVIGLPPLIGAAAAYGFALRAQRRRAMQALGLSAVCLAVLVVGIAPTSVSRHQDGPHFAAVIRELFPERPVKLAAFEYFSPNLVFYATDNVYRVQRTQVATFFDEHPQGLLITRADRLDQVQAALPGDVMELARERRFLNDYDLVLLGRPTQTVQQARLSAPVTSQ